MPLILLCLSLVGLWALGSAAKILGLAFAAAYLSFPLVRWLEKRGVPPLYAVSGIFVLVSGLATLIGLFVLPSLFSDLQTFITKLPALASAANLKIRELLVRFNLSILPRDANMQSYLNEHMVKLLQNFADPFWKMLEGVVSGAGSVVVWVLNVILFPIFFFYLVLDYPNIKPTIMNFVPMNIRPKFKSYMAKFDDILSGFIRGQLIVCSCLAAMYSTGLAISGVEFGVLIGISCGYLSFIPYLGAIAVVAISVLVSLANSAGFEIYLGIAITIAIVQSLESFYLTPRLVGNKVGLNSLLTILALIAGANVAGFWGILLAIPIAGMLRVIILDLIDSNSFASRAGS